MGAIPTDASRDPISFREANALFAPKEDVGEIKLALRDINAKLDRIVPRTEHERVWEDEKEYRKRQEAVDADFERRVRAMESNRIPQWAFTILAPIVSAIIMYFILRHP